MRILTAASLFLLLSACGDDSDSISNIEQPTEASQFSAGEKQAVVIVTDYTLSIGGE